MPKKVYTALTPTQLERLRERIRESGLSYADIARQLSAHMCFNSTTAKLRGDRPMSEDQLEKVLEVIKVAEAKKKKIAKMLSK